ncbi:MAG: hypothetical protein AAB089_04460, partial [Nitrospirota bacterium]
KAQSTAEYAIVIGLVIAAVVGMQLYVKRKLQGKIRDATNYIDPNVPATGKYGIGGTTANQYEPYYNTEIDLRTISNREETVETKALGNVIRDTEYGKEKTTRSGKTGVTSNLYAD